MAQGSEFWVRGYPESNRHFRIEFPSATSAYYLIRSADLPNDSAGWSVTGIVWGVEGTQTWRNEEALTQTLRRFYRVGKRSVSNPADSDADGPDDIWELRYGFNPLDPADARLDPDGDGFSNLQEYEAGANPRRFDPPPEIAITSPKEGHILP